MNFATSETSERFCVIGLLQRNAKSSRSEVYVKKVFRKTLQNLQENTRDGVSF